jgi:transcriptional regulator with XRE-family HTH domain
MPTEDVQHDVPSPGPSTEFGPILRHWRRVRGLSQQSLAERAGMSTRHLSFLETGRCGPSRSAVLQLGKALDVPDAEVERLLLLAGYAGDWTRPVGDPVAVGAQLERIAHLLDAHDPLPAFVTDPAWCVRWANRSARGFFRRMQEIRPDLCVAPLDLRTMFADETFAQIVSNWSDLLHAVVAGLYQLEPDPAAADQTRALMDVLPPGEHLGAAIERAARTMVWSERMQVHDRGVDFDVELVSLPFAGAGSGYALVVTHASDPETAPIAREYFAKLAGLPTR